MNKLSIGDVVISLKGRDKDRPYLVCEIDKDFAYIVDGKVRKVTSKKKKNVKHLKKVEGATEKELALKIQNGYPVGNDRVSRAVKAVKKIIRED